MKLFSSFKNSLIGSVTKLTDQSEGDYLPSSFIAALLVFILPVLFSFSITTSNDAWKTLLLVLFIVISIVTASVSSLRTGAFKISWGVGSLAVILLGLSYLLSSILSSSFKGTFLGVGGDVYAGIVFVFLAILSLIFAHQAVSRTKTAFVLFGVWASFVLVSLFHLVRLAVGPEFLSFSQFLTQTATPVGKWYDLALFAAFSALTALAVADSRIFVRWGKMASYIIIAFSLVLLLVIDFNLAWILLAAFSLALFIRGFVTQSYSEEVQTGKPTIPLIPLLVFVISVVGILFGGILSSSLAERVGIGYAEVRPSWSATWEVNNEVTKSNPFFGLGSNKFQNAWRLHKPAVVNETLFWNVDYRGGIGTVPSTVSSVGILGFLSWIFLGIWIAFGFIRELFGKEDKKMLGIPLAVTGGALLLWISAFFYQPSFTLVALLFVFVGLSQSLDFLNGRSARYQFPFMTSPLKASVGVIILIIAILSSIGVGYIEINKFLATHEFGNTLVSMNEGDIQASAESLGKAINYNDNDLYYRLMAGLVVRDLESAISTNGEELSQEAFQNSASNALALTQRAIDFDPSNYDNWLILGGLYEYLANFGVDGASLAATDAYGKAGELNPSSPAIELSLARVHLIEGEALDAERYIQSALEKKSNYTQALLLRSRLELGAGDREAALRTMTQAALSSPDDPTVFFQLGVLLYDLERFEEAATSLERAVITNSVFADAKYLLGLSYYELGMLNEAVAQFEDLNTLIPDNEVIETILSNLIAGREPISE
jgi:tetratricopeptide (TPR) repeat protein